MFSIEIYKLNRNGTERTSGKAGVGDGGRAPRPAERLLVVRWAGRCGERTERCQWQRKRSERVAAVKILSDSRKAAQKFWAPQQDHRPLRRFDKKVPAWNPSVTASPCQGPLGKGAFGDGGCGLPQPACAGFAMTYYKKCGGWWHTWMPPYKVFVGQGPRALP